MNKGGKRLFFCLCVVRYKGGGEERGITTEEKEGNCRNSEDFVS